MYSQSPLTRFSDRSHDYARYRPSYPTAAIDAIVQGFVGGAVAADIGAGTGISARLLADRGLRVIAIEPNTAMAEAALPHPNVHYQAATAEQTGLETASIDLVGCFQAFHWFEPEVSLVEFHRILKPQGRLVLVWNDRERSDPFTQAYSQLMKAASGDHPANRHIESARPQDVLENSLYFEQLHHAEFPYAQALSFEALLGRVRSSSYISLEENDLKILQDQLQELFEQWINQNGEVDLKYRTHVYRVVAR
ncbi:MAG: methyltransferase domain-containing protein [Anaerolineae bacterium]|nr:methyltransferase domain-containing protein [Gloeobacterales cyanobacterium ES-bin-313]